MHYNDLLFDAIHHEKQLDLTVSYLVQKSASHPWKTDQGSLHQRRYYKKFLGIDWFLFKRSLSLNKKDLFVLGSWVDLTAILCIVTLSIKRRAFVIWTDSPSLKGTRGGLFPLLRSVWVKFIFRNSKYILGTGKMALNNLRMMGCPKNKLVNLPYFTNLEAFCPKKSSGQAKPLILLSSGRLVNAKKGFDDMIRAIALMKKENPNVPLEYRIAGTGPDLHNLQSLVKMESLEKNVIFEGWLEPKDLIDFYQSGDIYVHPAHDEPYGVVVLEAMASGLAVIGSDKTGAVVDRVVNGKNGFVFNSGNVEEIKSCLYRLFHDRSLLESFQIESRKTAENWPFSVGVETIKRIATQL